jgi:hypothetical protein
MYSPSEIATKAKERVENLLFETSCLDITNGLRDLVNSPFGALKILIEGFG